MGLELLNEGNQEGSRLARSRSGHTNDIMALQDKGNALPLNRGRHLVALLDDGLQHIL